MRSWAELAVCVTCTGTRTFEPSSKVRVSNDWERTVIGLGGPRRPSGLRRQRARLEAAQPTGPQDLAAPAGRGHVWHAEVGNFGALGSVGIDSAEFPPAGPRRRDDGAVVHARLPS